MMLTQSLSCSLAVVVCLVAFTGSNRSIHADLAEIYAPIDFQEVWAAGVTYYRSREARMEESTDAGGGTFYDKVYEAPRPELFFKASPHRVVGTGQKVRIRHDSRRMESA